MQIKRLILPVLLAAAASLIMILHACVQPDVLPTPTPYPEYTLTPISSPTVDRELFVSEPTLTALLPDTPEATLGADMPSPTPTSTADGGYLVPLYWPPNGAVLHSAELPDFRFGFSGPFVMTVHIYKSDMGFELSIAESQLAATSVMLPDGVYYWSVSGSRLSGAAAYSDTWQFRIDTTCQCTDTPTP